MKVPVRAASQLQDLGITGGECFFVEQQHPAFHVFNVVMSGGVVVTIINEWFGNKSDLEQSSDAITKIPIFTDLHPRIKSANVIERFTTNVYRPRSRQ